MDNKFQTPLQSKQKKKFNKKLLTIPPSPFLEKLGYGTGVTVWKLQQSPENGCIRSPWAIKNVRKNVNKELTCKYQSLLEKEADTLKTLNHKNIVGFRGYLKSEDGRSCLAMEVGGESLGNIIEKRFEDNLGPFPAETILNVALNIAKALKYLHEDKRLLHGDIKSYNIVIKNDFKEVKLCDFGVSISLDDKNIKKKYIGTPIYSAPECQEGAEGPVTAKADIFSLGLVLWEMMALTPPHVQDLWSNESCESELDDSDCSDDKNFEENYGTRPPLPNVELGPEYSAVIEIFYCCTEQSPEKRPTAAEIVERLSNPEKP